jgi:DNA-binding CsgD family transcriptional regulator/tetratricopeptide (TPR) repeat protein
MPIDGGFFTGACPALLERDAELGALTRALADVSNGAGGRLLLVAGEAGIGKSLLLQRFLADGGAGVRTLRGASERLFTPRALGPFLDVADRAGGELAAVATRGVTPYELLPVLLQELRGDLPTVLVLEDLHWADEGTLDVLRLLAGRLDGVPALVLGSFRDDELGRDHPFQLVLGELAGNPRVERLALRPLSPAAVRVMAEPFGADERELYAKTAGNPFFVTEVLCAGQARIPDSVRDAVLSRAARLPSRARRLLEVAAVVPARIDLWLLEAIAGEDLAALEDCLAAGSLGVDGSTIAFRHELARAAIEEATPPDRRLALHRKVLAALSVPPVGKPDPARLAHHAEAAGDAEAVLVHAPLAAARAAALGAHIQSAAQYARALRFADGLSAARRARLYERWAYESYLVDHLEDALDATDEALARRRMLGQRIHEADVLRLRSKLLWVAGRAEEAEQAGRDAVALLEPLSRGPELALAYSHMSNLALYRRDRAQTVAFGQKAVEIAEPRGLLEVLASVRDSIGSVECLTGMPEGIAKIEESLELAREAGVDEEIARALVNLTAAALDLREYGTAERYLAEGLAYTDNRDLGCYRSYLLAFAASLQLSRGRLAAAVTAAETALRPRPMIPMFRTIGLIVSGRARARSGDEGAWETLDEARLLASPVDLNLLGPLALARAEAAWLFATPETIDADTDLALRLALECGDVWLAAELVYWRSKAGLEDDVAVEAATPFALQLAGRGRAAAAEWTKLGCPYEAALALADVDTPDALHRALSELQRIGAEPAAKIVTRRLRELGVRRIARGPRGATRANPALLTTRELDVLSLLQEGLRNSEIARRLYITPKTVDHHVSAILRKLGVHSRRDAVAEARRRGLAAAT